MGGKTRRVVRTMTVGATRTRIGLLAPLAVALTLGCGSSGRSPQLGGGAGVTPQAVQGVGGGLNTVSMASGGNASSTEISASIEEVWGAVQAAYTVLNIPITLRQKETFLVGNTSYRVRRRVGDLAMIRVLDCGGDRGMPNAETYQITMSVQSQLSPGESGGTVLQTLVEASARGVTTNTMNDVRCSSEGALERRIAELVQQKIEAN